MGTLQSVCEMCAPDPVWFGLPSIGGFCDEKRATNCTDDAVASRPSASPEPRPGCTQQIAAYIMTSYHEHPGRDPPPVLPACSSNPSWPPAIAHLRRGAARSPVGRVAKAAPAFDGRRGRPAPTGAISLPVLLRLLSHPPASGTCGALRGCSAQAGRCSASAPDRPQLPQR